jgi:hypothetical protein
MDGDGCILKWVVELGDELNMRLLNIHIIMSMCALIYICSNYICMFFFQFEHTQGVAC